MKHAEPDTSMVPLSGRYMKGAPTFLSCVRNSMPCVVLIVNLSLAVVGLGQVGVGDSILGYRAHLAAGVILSNVRLDRGEVSVRYQETKIPTGLKKFGAVVGDKAEIGCNSVISPGSLIGRESLIYPLTHFSGVLAQNTILQNHQNLRTIPRAALG